MCSKTSTGKSTPDFSAQIEKLKQALKNADAVLIGARAPDSPHRRASPIPALALKRTSLILP